MLESVVNEGMKNLVSAERDCIIEATILRVRYVLNADKVGILSRYSKFNKELLI